MGLDALALVVIGAIVHATWNLLAKKASGGVPFVWLYGLVSLVCAVPVGLLAWRHDPRPLDMKVWLVIIASAVVHVLYAVVLQKGYQKSDFSVVYPLARGTGPLFSVFAAILLLGEMPGLVGWLGIGFILLGILLIAGIAGLRGPASDHDRLPRGVLWGVVTGGSIAAYTVIDGYAVKVLSLAPVIYYILGLVFRSILLAPVALRSPQLLKKQWECNRRHIVAVGILAPFAYTLILHAMQRAPLSYVAPVRELSMLFGVVAGAQLLRERFVLSRVFGTALMMLGVIMLTRA